MEILKRIINLGVTLSISRGTNSAISIIVSPLFNQDIIDEEIIFLGDNLEQTLIKVDDYLSYSKS